MIFLIFGFGKFGQLSLHRIAKMENNAHLKFIIIDKNDHSPLKEELISLYPHHQIEIIIGGVGDLWDQIEKISRNCSYYIIPTAPIHLMAKLLLYIIDSKFKKFILSVENLILPKDIPKTLGTSVGEGVIYFSYAPFNKICPDNCLGKEGFCHFHNIDKSCGVHDYLSIVYRKVTDFNFKSHQIVPGIGGIKSDDFCVKLDTLTNILLNSNSSLVLTISTACNCHGVVNQYILESSF